MLEPSVKTADDDRLSPRRTTSAASTRTSCSRRSTSSRDAIASTLRGRLDTRFATARLGGLNLSARELRAFRRVHIIACGSALYAGVVGAGMLESLARLPAAAEPAAEFRYRNPVIEPDTLYVAVSQSGETADTLAAVEEVVRKGGRVLGIVNVAGFEHLARVDAAASTCTPAPRSGGLDQGLHLHGRRLRAARPASRPAARPRPG